MIDRRFILRGFSLCLVTPILGAQTASSVSGQKPLSLERVSAPGSGTVLNQRSWSIDELESLSQATVQTRSPWDAKRRKFSGPLLKDVLQQSEMLPATLLTAKALNDYVVQIPIEDLIKFKVVLATRVDGQRMTIRNRGPLMVMYPFDEFPELQASKYYERCIWQLKHINVA